jgi:alkanesulfonate monooxygenase SsuD/methylene tetrahydromethanopterin reductase-like flavin-dependent oxidoreductase (luciferase family)
VLPKPVSKIPVLIAGGYTRASEDRIARRGDGWLSLGAFGAKTNKSTWDRICDAVAEHGRDASLMEHVVCANITFTERPTGSGRSPFDGTLDQIVEDILEVAGTGAHELVVDINVQDWFISSEQMLETAVEIYERVTAAGI